MRHKQCAGRERYVFICVSVTKRYVFICVSVTKRYVFTCVSVTKRYVFVCVSVTMLLGQVYKQIIFLRGFPSPLLL